MNQVPNPGESFSTPKNDSERFRPTTLRTPGALTKLAEYWVAEYGGQGLRFSRQQEYDLAQQIRQGNAAKELLDEGESTDPELSEVITKGLRARTALVEANLAFAFMYARESVGIHHANVLKKYREGGAAYRQANPAQPGKQPRRYGESKRGFLGTFTPLRTMKSPYASMEDRYTYATIGMMEAVGTFNPPEPPLAKADGPGGFIGYASWRIQSGIQRGMHSEEHNGIRLTEDRHGKINDYFGDHPTEEEDEQMPADVARLIQLTDYVDYPEMTSTRQEGGLEEINDPWNEEDYPETLAELYRDESRDTETVVGQSTLHETLVELLDHLSEREAFIIRARFGLGGGTPLTLDQIGDILEITRGRVLQIESKTMAKLRHSSRSEHLGEYMLGSVNEGDSLPFDMVKRGDEIKLPVGQANFYGTHLYERAISRTVSETLYEQRVKEEKQAAKEVWQAYPSEPWDMPPRRDFESKQPEYADTELFQFIYNVINDVDSYHFNKKFVESVGTAYPFGLIQRLDAYRQGKLLTHGQLSSIWERFMRNGYERLKTELGDDFSSDRVGQFFSKIIADSIGSIEAESQTLVLRIPESESGKIGYMASGLRFGKVKIIGNPGDYTAVHNQGFAEVEVVGDVGNGAGTDMRASASLIVSGHAGWHTGLGARDDAYIAVETYASVGDAADDQPHVYARYLRRA